MLRSLLLESKSYQDYIKSELAVRKNRNPSYSLRAFARDLDVSCSYLSEILTGKATLSPSKAQQIMTGLQGSEDEVKYFCSLVVSQSSKGKSESRLAKKLITVMKSDQKLKGICLDEFHFIADWYHLAIIELFGICKQSITPQLLSEKLNLQVFEAEEALNRLIRLKLIHNDPREKRLVLNARSHVVGGEGTPSSAIRTYHKQMLKKAVSAIDNLSTEKREVNTLVFSANEHMKAEIKALLRNLQRDIAKVVSYPEPCDEIYTLSLQFFPISGKINEPVKKNP